jgi:hypothetical protein
MAIDLTVIQPVRQRFGDASTDLEDSLAEQAPLLVGKSKDFPFSCPNLDREPGAALQFESLGVTAPRAEQQSGPWNVLQFTSADIPGGINPGQGEFWKADSLLVTAKMLNEDNVRHIESLVVFARLLSAVVAFCVLLAISPSAHAGVGCGRAHCGKSSPTFINVYWDTSAATWDSDAAAIGPGVNEGQIDTFTAALVHSTYFSKLNQYSPTGVFTASILPSTTATTCGAPPPDVDTAHARMGTFMSCVMTLNPAITGDMIVNVFLPPQTINTSFCNSFTDSSGQMAHNEAEHDVTGVGGQPAYTFIPTTAACTGSAKLVYVALSHEMVEAATNPYLGAAGWQEWTPPYREIGDFCENSTIPTTPFLFGTVQQYWSNADNACVTGFASTSPLTVTSATICGTGHGMQLVLNGNFGAAPWDFASNPSRSSYLSVRIAGADNWTAFDFGGRPIGMVGLGRVLWSRRGGPGGSDQIEIFGFDTVYGSAGQIVKPGDNVTVTLWNPDNGAAATKSFPAPAAANFAGFNTPANMTVSEVFQVTGRIMDSQGCTVEAEPITWAASAGSFSSATATPDPTLGTFTGTYTAPDVAGQVSVGISIPVAVSTTVSVHPKVTALVQPQGDAAGGQTTVLNGAGFSPATTVMFGANAGTVQSISTDHSKVSLRPPASTPAGTTGSVAVSASVNGISGSGTAEYEYITAGVPVMDFLGGLNGQTTNVCNAGKILVSIYKADGTLDNGSINLSASYKAFQAAPFRRLASITVASGTTVVIYDGGPITAVNPKLPNSPVTETFPVMSASLCASLAAFQARLGHYVAGARPLHPSVPGCIGDCAVLKQTVLWVESEKEEASAVMVAVRGAEAAAVEKAYKIDSVSVDAERKLVAANPFALFSPKLGNNAEFVGPAVKIEKAEGSKEASTAIKDSCNISFRVPASEARGTYAILHLRTVGKRLAWIAEKPSVLDRNGRILTTAAQLTGTYALVRLTEEKAVQ